MKSGNCFTTFYAKATKKGKLKKPIGNDKKCTHCKIKGHDIKECWKLKKECESKAANFKSDFKAMKSTTASTATAKVAMIESTASDQNLNNDLPQSPILIFCTHILNSSLLDLEHYTYPKVK
jgi:hypothetical protein